MSDDPNLIGALETAQLTANALQKLPRRTLGRGTRAMLIALRVYVLLAIPVVGYAFIHALMSAP